MPPAEAAPSLEDRASIFDSVGNSIDSLVGGVKEMPHLAKETAYYGYYTAKPLTAIAGAYLLGGKKMLINALIMAGGFVAGRVLGKLRKKEKIIQKETYKELANEGTVGAVMGSIMTYVFRGVHYMANALTSAYGKAAGLASKAAASIVTIPPFMINHEYLNRLLIKDYKPKPWEELKKEMWKVGKVLGLPRMANFTFVPLAYNIPAAVAINTTYGFIRAKPKKKEEKAQKQYQPPQTQAMPNSL